MGPQGLEARGAACFVIDIDHHRVACPYARIGRRSEGTSQKDDGADQKDRRCGDLGGDQGPPGSPGTRIPRHFTARDAHQVEARGLQRWCEPEEDCGHDGPSHEEQQQSPVRCRSRQVQ